MLSTLRARLAAQPPTVATVLGGLLRAPGTLLWLTALVVTGVLGEELSDQQLGDRLLAASTNLTNLAHQPVRVLVDSALWDGHAVWWLLLVLGSVSWTVERWLGTVRWFAVLFGAHVVGTLVSQGVVAMQVAHGLAPASAEVVLDYGVSYAMAGALGILAHRFPPRWQALYVTVALADFTFPFWAPGHPPVTFTDLGHLVALLTGLAAYRLAPAAVDPTAEAEPPLDELVADSLVDERLVLEDAVPAGSPTD